MCLPLPILTGSGAHRAKPIGAVGLVTGHITIAYQSADLGRGRPAASFTNHYHRTGGEGGQAIDVSAVASVAGWATVVYVM